MKLPRDLSGRELVKLLCRNWGYRAVDQEGSHIVVTTEKPSHQRMAIPDHAALRVGTLNNILRAVAAHQGVEREDILRPR